MRSFMEVTYDEDRYVLIEDVVTVVNTPSGGLLVLDDEGTEYWLAPGFICVGYGPEVEDEDEDEDEGQFEFELLFDFEPVEVNFEQVN